MLQKFKLLTALIFSMVITFCGVGFSSHQHALEELIKNDSALEDLSFDIWVVTFMDSAKPDSADNGVLKISIQIEEALRGKAKLGQILEATLEDLGTQSLETHAHKGETSYLLKPKELKTGDKAIVFIKKGPPLTINSGSIYLYKDIIRYRVNVNMTPAPQKVNYWLISLAVLVVLLIVAGWFIKKKILPDLMGK